MGNRAPIHRTIQNLIEAESNRSTWGGSRCTQVRDWVSLTSRFFPKHGFSSGLCPEFFPMEGFPPGPAWGFSPLTINSASVRGGWFSRRCAVLPRTLFLHLIQCCDQCSTWDYLCAYGRTGHAVGVALVLSDAPFQPQVGHHSCQSFGRSSVSCSPVGLGPCLCIL